MSKLGIFIISFDVFFFSCALAFTQVNVWRRTKVSLIFEYVLLYFIDANEIFKLEKIVGFPNIKES